MTASPMCGPVAVTPRDRSRGMAAVVLAVVAWGMGGVIIKLVDTGALVFAFYRLWLAVVFLVTVLLATRRRFTWAGLRTSGPGGALFGLHIVLFVSAVQRTSVADVTLIGALQPVLLLVVGPWLGEQITARHVAWTAVAVAGVAVVVVGSAGSPVWSLSGDVLAVGSVMTFTGYFLVSKRARVNLGTLEYFAGLQLVAAVVVTPLVFLAHHNLSLSSASDQLLLLFFVLVPGSGGHLLMNWAHRYVDVWASSLLILGVPVVATAGATALLSEPLGPLQVIGGLLILAATAAVTTRP